MTRGTPAARPGVNLEFKAPLADVAATVARLGALGARGEGTLAQRDTYFRVRSGRLKLRELDGRAELIEYQRDEDGGDRWSRYTVAPVADVAGTITRLASEHGVRGVVSKSRWLWIYRNARVHLDTVDRLGTFFEIEVVDPVTAEDGAALLDELLDALSIRRASAILGSYIDLIEAARVEDGSELTLPDLLAPGLDLVFVGINPSVYSAERGQYFARPSNRFWSLLNQSGLVPEPLGPADGGRLLEYGIGLTDIVKRATPSSAGLSAADFEAGRVVLREKLERCRPAVVCFVGKLAYQRYSGQRLLEFGRQPEMITGAAVFVMPSSSGLCNRYQAQRLACLDDVHRFLGR